MAAKKGLLAWLSAFVAFDMVILAALLTAHGDAVTSEPQLVTGMLGTFLTPPALLLLNALLSPDLKAALVFWRPRHALPGHRAFSKYAKGDPRIDVAALLGRLGDFPAEPVAQNVLWYRLYRHHREDASVLDANRRFLLFRDLATLSFLLAIVVPIVMKWLGMGATVAPAAAVFAVQYLIALVAAQQAGIRLVRTVLAIESTQ